MSAALGAAGFASLAAAAGYASLALLAVMVWRGRAARRSSPAARVAPVTILKPLCGAEPGLYEHLRSFCVQDYPQFQIVFGLSDPADPALAVVERLRSEFASLPMAVVVDPKLHGSNLKSSNLINMFGAADHDLLVIADSDVWVGPDYLAAVTAPLHDAAVGLVTCLYRDVPTPGLWSRLGAMYINEWFAPSVLLARLFGHASYASGQTLCLRRDTLEAIGGLAAIANHLADDYRLGELIRAQGLAIVLSDYEVHAQHDESSFASLERHEMRWMRTLKVLRPGSFRWIFLTFSLPLAVLGIGLIGFAGPVPALAWLLFAVAAAARIGLQLAHRRRGDERPLGDLALLPLRDALILMVWCRSFFQSRITWRGREFDVDAHGNMHRVA